jgi:putative glycosyltransferase (TIGR04372 family)
LSNLIKILKFLVSIMSFLVLLILLMFRPLIRVRLILIGFHKYGHLALEPDLMLMQLNDLKARESKKFPISFSIWSLGPRSLRANSVLADLWKQRLFVAPSWLINGLVSVGNQFNFLSLETPRASIFAPAYHHTSSVGPLQLSAKQNQEGRNSLIEMGIDPNRPYICLVVRDGGHYSDSSGPENPAYEFRNYDIDDFSELALSLIQRGYQVVRLGAGREKPFSIKYDGLIDYATSRFRSELLDVFLAANCSFAVSTQTGPDAVCLLFRRPVCYLEIPVFSQMFFGSGLTVWNPVIYERSGQKLSLYEIAASDLLWANTTDEVLNKGVRGIRSSSTEMVQNVASFVDYFESEFQLSPEDAQRSFAANQILENALGDKGKEVFGEVEALFNPAFLKRNADWYLQ